MGANVRPYIGLYSPERITIRYFGDDELILFRVFTYDIDSKKYDHRLNYPRQKVYNKVPHGPLLCFGLSDICL